jgi:Leucine rich repeat
MQRKFGICIMFVCLGAITHAAEPTPADATRLLDKLKVRYPKKGTITVVDLGRKKISDADLKIISALKTVQDLNLEGSVLKEVSGKPIYSKEQISDEGLKNLAGMTNLRSLNLCGTNTTDAGLKYLGGMKDLQNLLLSSTKVTDAGMEDLMKLPKLQSLMLYDTQVTDTGVFALKRWKIELKIGK